MTSHELLIHNIRSVYNVGAMFRTADGVGVSHIHLSGYSPTPVDRFGRLRQDFHKCALGAEASVPWTYHESALDLISEKKKSGYTIIGLEQTDRSVDYKTIDTPEKVLLVIGTEVGGMDPEIIDACDVLIDIPMRGEKDSLNVSVATGVALYRLFDR